MEGSRKIKTAILYAYNGSKFNGSQIQNNHADTRTVEQDLEKALFDAGCISQENFGNLGKIKWSRASRTDKGVHALCTVAGLRMLWGHNKQEEDVINDINSHLPVDIRIIGLKVVANKFNAKNHADYREYEYLFPLKALYPDQEFNSDIVKNINAITSRIQGTHSFHNYSRDAQMNTPQAKRYVVKYEVASCPIIHENRQYLKFLFIGQSFIYHQIRKMIGMTVSILLGKYTIELIEDSFKLPKFYIPLAPADGLALGRVHYPTYNRKMTHRPLHISEADEKRMKEYYETHILPNIVSSDLVFIEWVDKNIRNPDQIIEETQIEDEPNEDNKSDS